MLGEQKSCLHHGDIEDRKVRHPGISTQTGGEIGCALLIVHQMSPVIEWPM